MPLGHASRPATLRQLLESSSQPLGLALAIVDSMRTVIRDVAQAVPPGSTLPP